MPRPFEKRPMSDLRRSILALLAEGPMPTMEIARRLGTDNKHSRIGSELWYMEVNGDVKVCGTAWEAGYLQGYRSTTRAYGLPHEPILPGVDEDAIRAQLGGMATPRKRRVRRQKAGSGVIAGKPYRTGYRWGNLLQSGGRW